MVSRSCGRPPNPKNFLTCGRLRCFAGVCGRLRAFAGLRAFCGQFRAGKRKKGPILQSHEHIGVLVVLGDFMEKNDI